MKVNNITIKNQYVDNMAHVIRNFDELEKIAKNNSFHDLDDKDRERLYGAGRADVVPKYWGEIETDEGVFKFEANIYYGYSLKIWNEQGVLVVDESDGYEPETLDITNMINTIVLQSARALLKQTWTKQNNWFEDEIKKHLTN